MPSRAPRLLLLLAVMTVLGGFLLSGLLLLQGHEGAERPSPPPRPPRLMEARLRPKPGGGARVAEPPPPPVAVFRHPNGWRTETRKTKDSSRLRQETYDGDNALTEVRIFKMDGEGRVKNGVIYDSRGKPAVSTRYIYDSAGGQLLMEELYSKNGVLARRLYYPGALKEPEFAGRTVAFSFDAEKRNPEPVEMNGPVPPVMPVTRSGEAFIPALLKPAG